MKKTFTQINVLTAAMLYVFLLNGCALDKQIDAEISPVSSVEEKIEITATVSATSEITPSQTPTPKLEPLKDLDSDSEFVFTDTALEDMIRIQLNKNNDEPILVSEIREISTVKIIGEINAVVENVDYGYINECGVEGAIYSDDRIVYSEGHISSLEDFRYFTSLTTLHILNNDVVDMLPLSEVTTLENLHLGINNLVNVSYLSSLTNLKKLILCHNNIRDIEWISGMNKLELLVIDSNAISDISPAEGMESIKVFDIAGNDVHDLSTIASMTNITELNLDYFSGMNFSPILELKNLNYIRIVAHGHSIDEEAQEILASLEEQGVVVECD